MLDDDGDLDMLDDDEAAQPSAPGPLFPLPQALGGALMSYDPATGTFGAGGMAGGLDVVPEAGRILAQLLWSRGGARLDSDTKGTGSAYQQPESWPVRDPESLYQNMASRVALNPGRTPLIRPVSAAAGGSSLDKRNSLNNMAGQAPDEDTGSAQGRMTAVAGGDDNIPTAGTSGQDTLARNDEDYSQIDASRARAADEAAASRAAPVTVPGSALAARRRYVENGGGAIFPIAKNPQADASAPAFEMDSFNTVNQYSPYIEAAASKWNVDPDLVRAIMYMEQTHGYYDRFVQPFGLNHTILPMNVHDSKWHDIGIDRKKLGDPEKNIDAGARIIAGIMANLSPEDRSVAKVATLYQQMGADKVTNYGARVESIYKAKPWIKK